MLPPHRAAQAAAAGFFIGVLALAILIRVTL